MSGITVDPNELEELARYQKQAAAKAKVGANRTDDLDTSLWLTHGVISGNSTGALASLEKDRQAAGYAIHDACLRLAASLHAAADVYEDIDRRLAETHLDIRSQS